MNHGAHVGIENGFLKVKSKRCVVKFDMKLKSGSSYLMCARMIPMTDSYHENAMITQKKKECFTKNCNDEQQSGMENSNVMN